MEYHTPVLLAECLQLLNPLPGQVFIDATVGNGGHSIGILSAGSIVYGFDQDPTNLQIATQRIQAEGLGQNFHPIHANFTDIPTIGKNVDGIIFDLGLSKNQLIATNRGFSFNDQSSLDMRLDPKQQQHSAQEIINTYQEDKLFEIFSKYGQETCSRQLAKTIVAHRPFSSAKQLSNLIVNTIHRRPTRIHPATKIFMALRIYTNNEILQLKEVLAKTLNVVKKNGIVCIISFHSGEDRLVKQFINSSSTKLINLTTKPITPLKAELAANPLSRSAKLRAYKIR